MYMIMMTAATVTLMMIMIIMMSYAMSKKTMMDWEKMSPFERGFDPKSSSRMPFSIQFFLIAELFLIFDIENVLILPMTLILKTTYLTSWYLTITSFMMILIAGLIHEWMNGVLEWLKYGL